MDKPLQILVLSSMPLNNSGGLGKDVVYALKSAGHQVDFMTKYGYKGQENYVINVLKEPWKERFKKIPYLLKLKRKLLGVRNKKHVHSEQGIVIVSMDETRPVVPSQQVADKITRKYDCVITLFWDGMVTADTLQAVYNKLKCPVIIYSVDMFPMTGGCFYFQDCRNFRTQCGQCPVLGGTDPNDASRANFLYKKQVYECVKPAFVGNSWMNKYAAQSGLFDANHLFNCSIVLDAERFKPLDKTACRKRLQLDTSKRFVMLCRYFGKTDTRKGYPYLKEAMKLLADKLTAQERNQMLLVFIGLCDDTLQEDFLFPTVNLGTLNVNDLIAAYSAANVFLSPAVVDAGPSMVNQSMMCGTPVVSFETGTALDVIDNLKTGYKARYKDVADYAEGIMAFYRKPDFDTAQCREAAMQFNSYAVFARTMEHAYQVLKHGEHS